MLRLVSFSIDYHWACNRIGIVDVWQLFPHGESKYSHT